MWFTLLINIFKNGRQYKVIDYTVIEFIFALKLMMFGKVTYFIKRELII